MPDTLLSALNQEHVALRELLFTALDALVEGDAALAKSSFQEFTTRLLDHAAAEEAHLIPLFASRGLESTGCTAAILLADHAKLRRLLHEARGRLPRPGTTISPRARVEAVLAMRTLIELLAHHDERERSGFFPALDVALTEEERAALYVICARSQASA
ncbi:MAG: hemerythrin domain-containing protein [Planctomycetota bacterium]|nr:hemerythrin domain-containing protein [Planctomycetota bacterium]